MKSSDNPNQSPPRRSRAGSALLDRSYSRTAPTNTYSRELGELPLPLGGRIVLQRQRATERQAVAAATPVLHSSIDRVLELSRQAVLGTERGSLSVDDLKSRVSRELASDLEQTEEGVGFKRMIPVQEIAALAEYMASNTLDVKGVHGMMWDNLTHEERVDFFDFLGHAELLRLYQSYCTLSIVSRNPALFNSAPASSSSPEEE